MDQHLKTMWQLVAYDLGNEAIGMWVATTLLSRTKQVHVDRHDDRTIQWHVGTSNDVTSVHGGGVHFFLLGNHSRIHTSTPGLPFVGRTPGVSSSRASFNKPNETMESSMHQAPQETHTCTSTDVRTSFFGFIPHLQRKPTPFRCESILSFSLMPTATHFDLLYPKSMRLPL